MSVIDKFEIDGVEYDFIDSTARSTANAAVPQTRTVNSKALSSNITLTPGDIAYDGTTTYTSGSLGAKVASTDGEVTDLKTHFNDSLYTDEPITITSGFNVSATGVTAKYENGKIVVYGTCTSTRVLLCFNDNVEFVTSTHSFAKTLDGGRYIISLEISGYNSNSETIIAYTHSKFETEKLFLNDGDFLVTENPVMFGLNIRKNQNYGTSESPTYYDFKITPIAELNNEVIAINNDLSDYIATYTGFIKGTYYDTRYSINIDSPDSNENYGSIAVPCKSGDKFICQTYAYGTASKRWAFVGSDGTILSSAEQAASNTKILNSKEIITAPDNSAYLVANHRYYSSDDTALAYSPIIYKLSNITQINEIAKQSGFITYYPEENYKNKVIAIFDKYLAVYEENTIKVSTNFGRTFPYSIDVSAIGSIVQGHFFATGTLALFTKTAAYYTSDYVTLNSASVYNSDGTSYTPETEYNFDIACDCPTKKYISGQDMFVFGNYTLADTPRAVIWYSIDDGHSYKIAYEFNLEDTLKARHTHEVYYYAAEDVFLILTGDSAADECNVISASYDVSNDAWTFTKLGGSSRDYKWSAVDVWNGEIYYANDITPGAIKKCTFANIGDASQHETILSNTPNDLTGIFIGKFGDILVTQSLYRSLGGATDNNTLSSREAALLMYYSSDRKTFNEIVIAPPMLSHNSIPFWFLPISNGHIVAETWQPDRSNKVPSVYLDEIVRASGFPNAFQP